MKFSERWRNYCVALLPDGSEPINVQAAIMPLHHIRKTDGAACVTENDIGHATSWRYVTPLELRLYLREHGNFRCHLELFSKTIRDFEAITFRVTVERFIWSEVMTHRSASRNASSSRAIPYQRMKKWIESDPAMPLHFGANRPGMQSGGAIERVDDAEAFLLDRLQRQFEDSDTLFEEYDLHKELVNRYEEPFGWINGVFTFTRSGFHNMLNLRLTPYAHPNYQRFALKAARLYQSTEPILLYPGDWHLPFVRDFVSPKGINRSFYTQQNIDELLTWSVARCAWTSYETVEGKVATFDQAKIRHDDCVRLFHATPCEHQNRATATDNRSGNMIGYDQYRQMIPGESCSEFDFSVLDRYKGHDYILPNDAHLLAGSTLKELQRIEIAKELAALARDKVVNHGG